MADSVLISADQSAHDSTVPIQMGNKESEEEGDVYKSEPKKKKSYRNQHCIKQKGGGRDCDISNICTHWHIFKICAVQAS